MPFKCAFTGLIRCHPSVLFQLCSHAAVYGSACIRQGSLTSQLFCDGALLLTVLYITTCLLQGLSASQLADLRDVDVAVHTPKPGPAVPKPAEVAAPDLMAQQSETQRITTQPGSTRTLLFVNTATALLDTSCKQNLCLLCFIAKPLIKQPSLVEHKWLTDLIRTRQHSSGTTASCCLRTTGYFALHIPQTYSQVSPRSSG
jgi:hypothetical protein